MPTFNLIGLSVKLSACKKCDKSPRLGLQGCADKPLSVTLHENEKI